MKSAWLCMAGLCLAVLAGCRHPTGYAGVYSVVVPVSSDQRVERFPLEEPLQLVRDISADNGVVELRVETMEVLSGLASREIYGRATWVPYRWYASLLKPVVAVTLVGPLWLSIYAPHTHGVESWGAGDYWRDVAAWFNPASGVPNGARQIEAEPRLVRVEERYLAVLERRAPLAGRRVVLSLGDQRVGEAVSSAEGVVRFDLAPLLTPALAAQDHVLRFSLETGGDETAEFALPLRGTVVQQYLQKTR